MRAKVICCLARKTCCAYKTPALCGLHTASLKVASKPLVNLSIQLLNQPSKIASKLANEMPDPLEASVKLSLTQGAQPHGLALFSLP